MRGRWDWSRSLDALNGRGGRLDAGEGQERWRRAGYWRGDDGFGRGLVKETTGDDAARAAMPICSATAEWGLVPRSSEKYPPLLL